MQHFISPVCDVLLYIWPPSRQTESLDDILCLIAAWFIFDLFAIWSFMWTIHINHYGHFGKHQCECFSSVPEQLKTKQTYSETRYCKLNHSLLIMYSPSLYFTVWIDWIWLIWLIFLFLWPHFIFINPNFKAESQSFWSSCPHQTFPFLNIQTKKLLKPLQAITLRYLFQFFNPFITACNLPGVFAIIDLSCIHKMLLAWCITGNKKVVKKQTCKLNLYWIFGKI